MQRPNAWNGREISGQLLQLGGQGGFSENVTMDSSKVKSSQPCNNLGEECFEHKKPSNYKGPQEGASREGQNGWNGVCIGDRAPGGPGGAAVARLCRRRALYVRGGILD